MAKANTVETTPALQRRLAGVDTLFFVAISLVIASAIVAVFLR